jgi:hypothetical protein
LLNARLILRLDPWLVPLLDARLAPLLNARLVFRLDPWLVPLLDARLIFRLHPLLGARLVALLDTGCQTTLRGCLLRQRSHGTACTLIRCYGPAAGGSSVPVLDDDTLAASIV